MKTYPRHYIALENGELLSYIARPQLLKPTIVFLHGNLSSSTNWTRTFEALEGDYDLLAIDLRGFGESSYKNKLTRLRDLAEDVADFIDFSQLSQVTLVGWSAGGGIALEVAALLPQRIKQVVLINSIGLNGFEQIIDMFPNVSPFFGMYASNPERIPHEFIVSHIESNFILRNRYFFKRLLRAGIFKRSQLDEDYENAIIMDTMRQHSFREFYFALLYFNLEKELADLADDPLSAIKCPIHVWHGIYDRVVNGQEAQNIVETFKEQATLTTFKHSGHAIMDDEFELYIKKLKELVD